MRQFVVVLAMLFAAVFVYGQSSASGGGGTTSLPAGAVFNAGHFVDNQSDPLLSPTGGETLTAFGTTWYDGTTYHQYYCYKVSTAFVIGHATSSDGVTWAKDSGNNPVLSGSGGSNWDGTDVCTPVVWKEGSTWNMLYRGDGTPDAFQRVGFATSTNGTTWTRTANNKCAAPANVGNGCVIDDGVSGASSSIDAYGIIKIGSTYTVGISDVGGGTARTIGVATSTDLINWTKDGSNPLWSNGRYCASYFKLGGYYYGIVPHYIGGLTNNAELELYRSTTFPMYASARTYLGIVKQQAAGLGAAGAGSWNSFALDTANVLTDDITKSTYNVTGGDLWMYYSGTADSAHTNFYEGLAVAAQGIEAPQDTFPGLPNGGYLVGPNLYLFPGTGSATISNGNAPGVSAQGTYYGGIYASGDGSNFKFEIVPNNKYTEIASDSFFRWSSTTAAGGSADTGISRVGVGILGVGAGTASDTTAKVEAAGYISAGTKFATNNGCGETTNLTGGATAGTIHTSGSTSCTTIVTLGNTATAPNGWACYAHDLTTTGDYNNPHISSSATTVTIISGTIVSGDTIEFGCVGY